MVKMIGVDLIFGGSAIVAAGWLQVKYADPLSAWYAQLWFVRSLDDWCGFDENWAYSAFMIWGRVCIAFGICSVAWFVPVNLRLVHRPRY